MELLQTRERTENLAEATFAGGCFWCMEQPFETLPGVVSVVSGYSGGEVENPTYEQVCSGSTGHREAVRITYDPSVTSYDDLLEAFWRQIDPTDPGGQFADRGFQYTTAVFYHDEGQRKAAEESKQRLAESGRFDAPITTPIEPITNFYPAESYHQGFCKTNPERYAAYRTASGREQFLNDTWDGKDSQKPSRDELRERLTPLQYHVTQEEGTEPAFDNEYWDEKGDGIYVDIVSGEPLFSSKDKYDSGTGWPSFTQPLESDNITTRRDDKLLVARTEVRSTAGSHLGHLFSDGPAPSGNRYCLNSAALRFIPKDQLEEEGYGEYAKLFG